MKGKEGSDFQKKQSGALFLIEVLILAARDGIIISDRQTASHNGKEFLLSPEDAVVIIDELYEARNMVEQNVDMELALRVAAFKLSDLVRMRKVS
jgi:hypothetical protein